MHAILTDLIEPYPHLDVCTAAIQSAFEMVRTAYQHGNKLLLCGNGGSAADCEHIVGELMKGYLSKRPIRGEVRRKLAEAYGDQGIYLADHLQGALPAISLVSHSALLTAFANDVAADMAFAQQVYGYGRPGDVLSAISTSGNATNVLHAVQMARVLGVGTVGLTGQAGGALKTVCDIAIRVPGTQTTTIQEQHIAVYHALCAMLEAEFFPQ